MHNVLSYSLLGMLIGIMVGIKSWNMTSTCLSEYQTVDLDLVAAEWKH